jgi:hypothetical protein
MGFLSSGRRDRITSPQWQSLVAEPMLARPGQDVEKSVDDVV